MPVILLVVFPINALRAVFMAAWTSMMPALVGRDQVGRASSYAEAVFSLSFIVGPAIAGILVTTIGAGWTLAHRRGDVRRLGRCDDARAPPAAR